MSEDETELASSESPTEHAHAWSVDNWADDTVPYLDARQRTTIWLRVCVALTAISVAGLIGVLLFVLHGRTATSPAAPETSTTPTAAASAPVAQREPAAPAAVPTVTETKTIPAAPAPAPDQASLQKFVMCGDGREGVVGGHTSCLFAENVRRAFYAADDGADIVAYSPVTGERYEMSCTAGYRAHFDDGSQRIATRCVGGDNDSAEVVIW
ncbi:hypothetical protein [Candidatus Mycobacterium methanotrophicum]|uniref:Serine/threonine protein kinase n=1 Tax=Candidatus Mycobacterium methanotrophicum TaxID=2943498 RepID=A0ABY4QIM8_9MYCO|nr:hypothetical protein [Candidatus Mycobacterium methanotrophicum]UQX09648.1 hypothetical protein M5I08_15010 [Candidatus Mycobacterium methanotrophicum]